MAQHHKVISQGVEANLVLFLNTTAARIVIHYTNPGSVPIDEALANSIFGSLAGLWTANLATFCPTTVAFARVDLRDINSEGQPLVASTATGHNGTAAAGQLLPNQLAACLTVRTNRSGRKYRGRMYWAGFAETANGSDNHMEPTFKTALDAFASGFVSAASVGGLTFGVAHMPTAFDENTGLPISPGLGFITPANQVICRDNVWDSQRRRAG
jgi:hypothetical protein